MQSRMDAVKSQVSQSTQSASLDQETVEFPPSLSIALMSTLDNVVQSSNLQSNFSAASNVQQAQNVRLGWLDAASMVILISHQVVFAIVAAVIHSQLH